MAIAHAVPLSGMHHPHDRSPLHTFLGILHILSQLSLLGKAIPGPPQERGNGPAVIPVAPGGHLIQSTYPYEVRI